MVRLYIDENVRGAITRGLRQRGVDVLTVQEEDKEGLPDPDVLDRATELGRALYTEDDDLLREARMRQQIGQPFAGVIYAHHKRTAVGICVEDLELIAKANEPEQYANRVTYLPLR